MDTNEKDFERENGFVTNFRDGIRKRVALSIAAKKTGHTVSIKNNCTDSLNRPLNDPKYRALYVLPLGDLSEFWSIVHEVEKMLLAR